MLKALEYCALCLLAFAAGVFLHYLGVMAFIDKELPAPPSVLWTFGGSGVLCYLLGFIYFAFMWAEMFRNRKLT